MCLQVGGQSTHVFLFLWLPSVYNDTLSDNQLAVCLTNKTSIRLRLDDRLKEKFLKL